MILNRKKKLFLFRLLLYNLPYESKIVTKNKRESSDIQETTDYCS